MCLSEAHTGRGCGIREVGLSPGDGASTWLGRAWVIELHADTCWDSCLDKAPRVAVEVGVEVRSR